MIVASGALAPAGAEASRISPGGLDEAAVPPPPDSLGPLDPRVDPFWQLSVDEPGSGAPEPAVETGPAPEPAVETGPAPEPVVETAPAPEPVVETAPALQPVVETAPAPEPVVETAPASERAAETAPGPDAPDLVAQPAEARSEQLEAYSVIINDRVQFFIDRFTGDRREIVDLWFSRSNRYLGMIREVFRAQGLPEDLAFMAMIESGFNPRAVSRAGAKGLWQFMAGTARRYGLRVDPWMDERLDPVKSTHAAAAHLRDLHRQFGSWPLVKAAYNAGQVKVSRAIQGVGSHDFWTLARSRFLRQETKDFVPAIHAATLIGRDPGRYGFETTSVEDVATATVSVPPRTNLKTLSARAGVPLETLRVLNAVLVRGVTPPGAAYTLTIPHGTAEPIQAALAPPPGIHVVKPRETVSFIAQRYGVTVAEVLRWNNLQERSVIRPGDRLRVGEPQFAAGQDSAPVPR
jgi:membrane-bound lytic murein transglycosylase D